MGNRVTPREIEPGEVFGRLTVIERDYDKEHELKQAGKRCCRHYKCLCECGNITSVSVHNLLRGQTKSCGCLFKEARAGRKQIEDMTGKVFGNLTVIEQDFTKPFGSGKHAYWICECSLCGNRKSIRGSELKNGNVTDCGCMAGYRCGTGHLKDLTGMKFGHLEVLRRDMSIGTKSGQHAKWICRCDLCGNVESVSSSMLTQYGKDRCLDCAKGADGMSMGEQKIIELLDENGIRFLHNKKYGNCVYPQTGYSLFFDFVVFKTDEEDTAYIIEFDGLQHFKEIPQWEVSMNYDERKKHDKFKNEWCAENSIQMIRIPYTHLKELCFADLVPETSKFLIT